MLYIQWGKRSSDFGIGIARLSQQQIGLFRRKSSWTRTRGVSRSPYRKIFVGEFWPGGPLHLQKGSCKGEASAQPCHQHVLPENRKHLQGLCSSPQSWRLLTRSMKHQRIKKSKVETQLICQPPRPQKVLQSKCMGLVWAGGIFLKSLRTSKPAYPDHPTIWVTWLPSIRPDTMVGGSRYLRVDVPSKQKPPVAQRTEATHWHARNGRQIGGSLVKKKRLDSLAV